MRWLSEVGTYMTQKRYFGTDGVRGRVGEEPITPELMLRLGYAAGRVLVLESEGKSGDTPAVLIGKDTRISGYLLEAALEAGLSSAGVDVYLTGPLPTPAVAYLTRALRLSAGIVISASHNPFDDNGIKFFSASGTKLPDEVEHAIERSMDGPIACVSSKELGKAFRVNDAGGRYIEFCKSTFPNELDLKGLKIVVDCANGAAYHVAPPVFHELGADVVSVGSEPNGLNINADVGATHPKHLQAAVVEHRADLGLALDGDGDRRRALIPATAYQRTDPEGIRLALERLDPACRARSHCGARWLGSRIAATVGNGAGAARHGGSARGRSRGTLCERYRGCGGE